MNKILPGLKRELQNFGFYSLIMLVYGLGLIPLSLLFEFLNDWFVFFLGLLWFYFLMGFVVKFDKIKK